MKCDGRSRKNRMNQRYTEYSICVNEEISSSEEIEIVLRLDLLKPHKKSRGPSKYGHVTVG